MGQAQTNKIRKKSKRKFDPKEEYFIRNGAILLEKQIALSQSKQIGGQQLKFFSAKEIEKATNYFDPALIINIFGEGCAYKGTLDGKTVAVKTPRDQLDLNPKLIDLFLTEASIGMVLHHRNMMKLYGCCLETYIPILVYEFLPNRSLIRYLHGDTAIHKRLKWTDRLRIATETAYALSYMHNALSKPVVHRDLVSIGILLDASFNAKLGNFGYSVSVTPGKKDQSLPVHGTPGYIDPEYIETKEVTVKCDVYSFGVLMLELLTGREPIEMALRGTNLVTMFRSAVESNCMKEMIDSAVLEQENMDEIQEIARLAMACVADKGEERPTMIDIVNELRMMQCQNK